MSGGSLRLRLLIAAAISIATALGIAGLGLLLLMERYVERRVGAELHNHLVQLAASIDVGGNGEIGVTKSLADPRFSQPMSGLYWQIDANGTDIARSRSLWDERLDVPAPLSSPEDVHMHLLEGPNGIELYSQVRLAVVEVAGKEQPLVLTVGLDRAEIDMTVAAFRRDLFLSLVLLGLALTAAAWVQVNIGLKPLQLLRQRLERVRSGLAPKLEGSFPNEVQPLVAEVNSLLDAREQELARARKRAGNLAHGLKTPITVLKAVARRLATLGLHTEAGDIRNQSDHMHRHVERELARSRLASGHAVALTLLRPVVERLIDTIGRAPGAEQLMWQVDIVESSAVPIERGDLTELLGNILDNARKWARTAIHVTFNDGNIVVEDDGPGIPETEVEHVLERGAKLDACSPGSGLGLAIVRDIAELYGLGLTLGRSALGGLETRISPNKSVMSIAP